MPKDNNVQMIQNLTGLEHSTAELTQNLSQLRAVLKEQGITADFIKTKKGNYSLQARKSGRFVSHADVNKMLKGNDTNVELATLEKEGLEILNAELAGLKNTLGQKGLFHPRVKQKKNGEMYIEGRNALGQFISKQQIEEAQIEAAEKADKKKKDAEAEGVLNLTSDMAIDEEEEDIKIGAKSLPLTPEQEEEKKKRKPVDLEGFDAQYVTFLEQFKQFAPEGTTAADLHAIIGDDFAARIRDDGHATSYHAGGVMQVHYKDGGSLIIQKGNDGRLYISLDGKDMDEQTANDFVFLQKSRNPEPLLISGPQEASSILWRVSHQQNMAISNEEGAYVPTEEDRAWLKAYKEGENPAVSNKPQALAKDKAPAVEAAPIATPDQPTQEAKDSINSRFVDPVLEGGDDGLTIPEPLSLEDVPSPTPPLVNEDKPKTIPEEDAKDTREGTLKTPSKVIEGLVEANKNGPNHDVDTSGNKVLEAQAEAHRKKKPGILSRFIVKKRKKVAPKDENNSQIVNQPPKPRVAPSIPKGGPGGR